MNLHTYIYIIILLLFRIELSSSQNKTFNFPLSAGNQWYYAYEYVLGPLYDKKYNVNVDRDTLMPNNKRYRIMSTGSRSIMYLRVEGSIVYGYSTSYDPPEYVRYDFSKNVGDTVSISISSYNSSSKSYNILTEDKQQLVFGVNRRMLKYRSTNGLINDLVIDSIGILYTNQNIEESYTLLGAQINGKIFGKLTNVKSNNTISPNEISLFHNYPNPFNPSTTISFVLNTRAHVELSVFTLLGQKIDVLVNDNIMPGKYNIEWNALKYPNGVYFGKLTSGGYVKMNKMLLVK